VASALLASRGPDLAARGFALKPLRFAGQISYCLYLVHIPILDMITTPDFRRWSAGLSSAAPDGGVWAVFLVASIGLASLSWYGFERPILKLKRHFADERSEAGKTAAASV
jgi:peptidoglycan/LPS O-acetylase OafA/YrhL